jgi:nitroreductase
MTTTSTPTPPPTADLAELLRQRYGGAAPALPGDHPQAQLFDSVLAHRSVRRYADRELAPGTLELLIAAAQSAPTSSNLQAWSVVAIQDPERKAKAALLAGDQGFIRQAPLFLLFIADLSRLDDASRQHGLPGTGLDYLELFLIAALDATLAAQNTIVTAEALGLGICCVGAVRNRPQEIAGLVGLPQRAIAVFGLAVGHPDPQAPAAVKPRLPQTEVLHRESYSSAGRAQALADFDRVALAFARSQGLSSPPWTRQIAERVGSVEVLRGRERLADNLRARGFPLR